MIMMGASRVLDELALKRAVSKGLKTQELIEGYKEAWDELEADLWQMWKATKSDDQVKREEIFREHHACKALQAKLEKTVNEGKKAEEELKQEKLKHGNRNST
jgi:septal ring factor EnvC (AmiA/AmiB activator)